MRSKYGNIKTTIDGITFDSKKEAMRYAELKMLQKGHAIYDLRMQVPFEIQPSFYKDGKKIQAIKYVADFTYYEGDKLVIEDVKSPITRNNQVYKLKKKMMEYRGYEIREV